MYELTCPTLERVLHLDRRHVLSTHRVSGGHVVYLRCACGAAVMWSSAGTTLHPRPVHHTVEAA